MAALVGAILMTGCSSGAEVILEPTTSSGASPFTTSVPTSEVSVSSGDLEELGESSEAVESLAGSTPELYGGTGQEAVCEAGALTAFLDENQSEAEAFAGVVGVQSNELPDYIDSLTPVLLRADTRVTNHGFSDGEATPFDAVLQAGTAVLVDERGVPRVRCACGNPLTEPEGTDSTPDYTGEAWRDFDQDRLVAVAAASEPVERFRLVDVETGEAYDKAAGSGTITLARDGLGIVDFGAPAGETIEILIDKLGQPDEDLTRGCTLNGPQDDGRDLKWGRLYVSLADSFGFYRWRFLTGPSDFMGNPLPDSDLTTPEGLGQSASEGEFKATYGPVTEDEPSLLYADVILIRASPDFVAATYQGELTDFSAAASRIELAGVPGICTYPD